MANLLVVDTETGGVDPQVHSILSLAGVAWTDGRSVAQFETLIVEPVICVTSNALDVNRIQLSEHCKHGVSPEDAVVQIRAFLGRHFSTELRAGEKVTLVGHNVEFDIGFIKRLCRLANVRFDELFSHRVLDTVSILRYLALVGLVPPNCVGSDAAFAHFGIHVSDSERHTALGDAKATAQLLSSLIGLLRPWTAEGALRYAVG